MDSRQARDLDNYITGHYGEDQFRDDCPAREEGTMTITGRRPTLTDCGCEATVYADGSGIELHYCPMHQAAPQLLEALRECADALMLACPNGTGPGCYALHRALAAIKAAGG